MMAHDLARELLKGLNIEVSFTYHDASYGETIETVDEVAHVPARTRKPFGEVIQEPEMIVLS